MKKLVLALLLALGFCMDALAQQDAMYSQYMFNMLSVNPAYAGSRDVLSATAMKRWQWVNMDGAPETLTFTADMPVWHEKIGLGISFVNDQIGVTKNSSLYTSYSYRIRFLSGGTLAFGLQAGFTNMKANYLSLYTTTRNDQVFMENINEWLPNFGAGAYYSTDNFYVGLSAPHLINNTIIKGTESVQKQHFFITAGYVFRTSEVVSLKPSLLFKYVDGAPLEGDVNINVWFHDKVAVGASYRTGDAVVALAEFQINQQLRFGYAYDMTLTRIKAYSSGSHEIMLRYEFGYAKNKILTPRYF
ncbi:PorP/SprF family type IX secretion system membrane protein [Chryseosolibacter indicus]|uniref:Type IX secretion system membrane protein PorP/SprF n=1 Tax=Chryseosolibacter indicus TaxID=2782351 RepID=A0ABS5W2A6_9BACT|nr:type IX secretion system membrane protein PorP/SprF [Chryseosolibacter indicus]MBT1706396.1 type IX secretion system membrane protein PorP/SprF [Chryseosolibacter indicus]